MTDFHHVLTAGLVREISYAQTNLKDADDVITLRSRDCKNVTNSFQRRLWSLN